VVGDAVVAPALAEGMQHVDLKLPFPLGSPHFCAPCSKAKPEVHAPSPTVAQQLPSLAPFTKQAPGSAAERLPSQPETTPWTAGMAAMLNRSATRRAARKFTEASLRRGTDWRTPANRDSRAKIVQVIAMRGSDNAFGRLSEVILNLTGTASTMMASLRSGIAEIRVSWRVSDHTETEWESRK
jgi:hypothetical protein